MPNNLWPYISKYAIPAESQIAEGGGPFPADAYWNCVFACVSVALQVLGYPDLEPEEMRQLVQPGTHQGSSFERVAAYLQAHPERWPNLPRIDTWNPPDTIGTFDQMLAKGYITIFDVYNDGNGVVLNHAAPQGYTHAVLLEAQGATKTTIWNPEHGETEGQTFDKAFMKLATTGQYVGNLMVFARNIVPAPAVITPAPIIIPPVVGPVALPPLQLSDADIVALLQSVGFTGDGLLNACAVCFAESGGNAHASNTAGNTPPSTDRGLFQLNSFWHPEVSDAMAYDANRNAKEAYRISKNGTDWHQWSSWPVAAAAKIERARSAIAAAVLPPIVTPPIIVAPPVVIVPPEPPVALPDVPPAPPTGTWEWLRALIRWLLGK